MRACHIQAVLSVALVSVCSGDSACEAEPVSVLQARHRDDILVTVEKAKTHENKSMKTADCSFDVPLNFATFVGACQTQTLACYSDVTSTTAGSLAASMESCAKSWCCKSSNPGNCERTMDVFVQNNFGDDSRHLEREFVATRYCERLWTIWCPNNCRVGVVHHHWPKGTDCDGQCRSGLLQTASLPEETPDATRSQKVQALLPGGSLLQKMTEHRVRRDSEQENLTHADRDAQDSLASSLLERSSQSSALASTVEEGMESKCNE